MEIVTEEIMLNLWFNHLQSIALEEEKNEKYAASASWLLLLLLCVKCLPWEIDEETNEEMVGESTKSTSPLFSPSLKFLLMPPQIHPQQLWSPTVCLLLMVLLMLFSLLLLLLFLVPRRKRQLVPWFPSGDVWRYLASSPSLFKMVWLLSSLMRLYSFWLLLWLLWSECCTIFVSPCNS